MNQPAGWYADPESASGQRYWNGVGWTEQRSPGPSHPAPPPMVQVNAGGAPAALAMPAGTMPGDKSSGLAGFLSFLIDGVGQMYAGYPGRGVAWLGGMFLGWFFTVLLSFVFIGLLFIPVMIGLHIWCIVDAASCASRRNYQLRMTQPLAMAGGPAVAPIAQATPAWSSPTPSPAPTAKPALPPAAGPRASETATDAIPPNETARPHPPQAKTSVSEFCEGCGNSVASGQPVCPLCGHKQGEPV